MSNIDSRLDQLLGEKQVESSNIDSRLDELLSSKQASSEGAVRGSLGQVIPQISSTPQDQELPFSDLAQLAFKSDSGKVGFLKNKFNFVEQNPETGKILVGNSPADAIEYDPTGFENGYLGFLANAISMVPEIAFQIGGATLGAATRNPLAVISLGGAGAVAGSTFKQQIGNMLPGGAFTPEEAAVDNIISGVFSAGGEALGMALKGAGKNIIKPQLTKMFDAAIEASPEKEKMLSNIAKVFKFTSAVDEKDVVDAGMYGFNKVINPKYSDNKYVSTITKDVVEGVLDHNKTMGEMVEQGDKWALSRFGNKSVELRDIGTALLDRLSQPDIKFINPVSRTLNREAFTKPEDFKVVKNILGEFFSTNKKTGQLLPRNKSFGDLLLTRKRMDSFLKGYQNSSNVNPVASNAINEFLSGIREKLAQETVPKSVNVADPKIMEQVVNNNPFLKANKLFSAWKKDLELLANNGLDVSDMKELRSSVTSSGVLNSKVESFVKRLQDKTFSTSGAFKKIVEQLPKKYPGGGIGGTEGTIFDEIRKFNAAQGFSNANPNFLRFGSIASYAGLFGLGMSDSKQNKLLSLAGGLLLGTPAGVGNLLKGSESLATNIAKQSGRKFKPLSFQSERVVTSLLSNLLKSKRDQ